MPLQITDSLKSINRSRKIDLRQLCWENMLKITKEIRFQFPRLYNRKRIKHFFFNCENRAGIKMQKQHAKLSDTAFMQSDFPSTRKR